MGEDEIDVAYSLSFFRFEGEAATHAATVLFSADASGPKAVEEAMRRDSAQREGEPLSEAESDLYLDAEANVLVFWHTEPEPASRSAVLGCLG